MSDAMFYSNRLGSLANAQLQAALDRFDLGTLVETAAISTGLFGQNLHLLSTRGQFVFRGAPHYEWQLPTERYFADYLHQHTTVPVPWPYLVEPASDLFPWPWGFAIMPTLPGASLAGAGVYDSLTLGQRIALARVEGETLWHLQQASSPVAGTYDVETGAIRPFENGYVNRTIDRALANAAAAFANGGYSEDDDTWLRSIVEPWRDLSLPARYTVVHEDFSRNNMVAAIDGDHITVTGVFDLMTCHYGDGLADLARQFSILLSEAEGERLARAYVGSYLDHRGPVDTIERERTLLYLVDERMLAWEYAHRPGHEGLGWWDLSMPLRAWLQPFLDTWSQTIRA